MHGRSEPKGSSLPCYAILADPAIQGSASPSPSVRAEFPDLHPYGGHRHRLPSPHRTADLARRSRPAAVTIRNRSSGKRASLSPNIRCCLTERRCRCRRTYKPFGCAFRARSALRAARLARRTCAPIVVRLSRIRSSASTSSRPRRVPRPAPRTSWPGWPACATGGHLRRGVRAGEGQGPFGLNSWPPWAVCAAGPDGPGKQEPAALGTRIRSSCAAACLTAGGWAQAPPARASGVPRHRGYRAGQPKTACSPGPDWLGSGRRIMRNEMSSPIKPARIGIRSAT